MFMDKVKNFCDHSMTLREMTDDLLTSGHFCPPPASFRVKRHINAFLQSFVQQMTSMCQIIALLLDLLSESGGKTLFISFNVIPPLNTKAKLPAADNFSLKQRVSTSTLVNFTLEVKGKKQSS